MVNRISGQKPGNGEQLVLAFDENPAMKHSNALWPLPVLFRVLDLRVAKKPGGLGLVFEVDVTDGRTVSTWRFGGVSLVETRPLDIDEDGPTLRLLRRALRVVMRCVSARTGPLS